MSAWREHDRAESHFVPSRDEPGLQLHLRCYAAAEDAPPVLFVHGATIASRIFDVPWPGASWLRACAGTGFSAYALDIRGYGKSHSNRMAEATLPYARADDAVKDIDDAVDWLCARHGVRQLALVGGSWGSVTTTLYVSGPGADKVARLALYAPIYGTRNEGWIDLLADPDDRTRLNPGLGAFRWVGEQETRQRWDGEIPTGQVSAWRDEAVLRALLQSTLADDPGAADGCFRAPNGTLADLWSCFTGRPLVDPRHIRCPTLLIRGGADPTSTRADALALLDGIAAFEKRYVEIGNGAHFISAERNAWQVFDEVNSFLLAGEHAAQRRAGHAERVLAQGSR